MRARGQRGVRRGSDADRAPGVDRRAARSDRPVHVLAAALRAWRRRARPGRSRRAIADDRRARPRRLRRQRDRSRPPRRRQHRRPAFDDVARAVRRVCRCKHRPEPHRPGRSREAARTRHRGIGATCRPGPAARRIDLGRGGRYLRLRTGRRCGECRGAARTRRPLRVHLEHLGLRSVGGTDDRVERDARTPRRCVARGDDPRHLRAVEAAVRARGQRGVRRGSDPDRAPGVDRRAVRPDRPVHVLAAALRARRRRARPRRSRRAIADDRRARPRCLHRRRARSRPTASSTLPAYLP